MKTLFEKLEEAYFNFLRKATESDESIRLYGFVAGILESFIFIVIPILLGHMMKALILNGFMQIILNGAILIAIFQNRVTIKQEYIQLYFYFEVGVISGIILCLLLN